MSATRAGNLKVRDTIIARYGKDHWAEIGSKGGKAKVPKGFALDPERASRAGLIGGASSRRTGILNGQGKPRKQPNKRIKSST